MAITRGVSIALIASSIALASCGSLNPLSRGDDTAAAEAQQGIGVNSFLWRASLDTLSFMPLITADPWGGVINYDWHTRPRRRTSASRPRSSSSTRAFAPTR